MHMLWCMSSTTNTPTIPPEHHAVVPDMPTTTPPNTIPAYEAILDGDDRYRIRIDGHVVGWVTKWYLRDAVNSTGIKRFSAKPMGLGIARHECETFSSAVAYLRGHAEPNASEVSR